MQNFSSYQQSSLPNIKQSSDDHQQALTNDYQSRKCQIQDEQKNSRFHRQRPIKFEESLRTYELPPKKHFHFDKNQNIQRNCFNEEEKLYPLQISKKIKTFQKGWHQRQKNVPSFEEEKENHYPMLFSITNEFQRIAQEKQDQNFDKSNLKPVTFIKQEEDSYSYSNSSSQRSQNQPLKLCTIPQKLSHFQQVQQGRSKHQENQKHQVTSENQENLYDVMKNNKNITQNQQQRKDDKRGIRKYKTQQQINLNSTKYEDQKVRKPIMQSPIKANKILNGSQINQDNNEKNSSIKKVVHSPNSFRFVPIMSDTKYFSLRLLRQLFGRLNKASLYKQSQRKSNPYKKQFKYLSNSSSQTRLQQIKSISDICRYLKEQKQFLKQEEIIKSLKQFIVQEGLNVEFYFPQLEKIDF